MPFPVSLWPFEFPHNASEYENRWWQECFLAPPALEKAVETPQWVLIYGPPLSGKSTLLQALQRYYRARPSLVISDIFQKREEKGWNFVSHLMYTAAWEVRQHLVHHPEGLDRLSRTQREFLRWVIEKFHRSRAFIRWLDGLPPHQAELFADVPYQDIYPTQTDPLDVHGQIEEMCNLCRRLGFDSIIVTFDVPFFAGLELLQQLDSLLGWLEPMQHPQLKVIITVPMRYLTPERARLPRDRIARFPLEYTVEAIQQTLDRFVHLATDGALHSMNELCLPGLRDQIQTLVEQEFSPFSLGAWIGILETLFRFIGQHSVSELPLAPHHFAKIRLMFFQKYLPLRLDAGNFNPGVWRGYRWIPLDPIEHEFLKEHLFRGSVVSHQSFGGSAANLHTIARRLRMSIEPDPSHPIYLLNRYGEGYYLENYIP